MKEEESESVEGRQDRELNLNSRQMAVAAAGCLGIDRCDRSLASVDILVDCRRLCHRRDKKIALRGILRSTHVGDACKSRDKLEQAALHLQTSRDFPRTSISPHSVLLVTPAQPRVADLGPFAPISCSSHPS